MQITLDSFSRVEESPKIARTKGLARFSPHRCFNGLWKECGDLAFQPQRNASLVILISRSAIDDDIRYTSARGQQWKRGSGMNRERRSKRNHKICHPRCFTGALKDDGIETLSETNGRRFQIPATLAARRFAMNSECFETGLRITAPTTGLTFYEQVCAMKFDQVLSVSAGQGVQSIDILGQHRDDFLRIFKFYDRFVHRIWPRGAKRRPSLQLVVPVLNSSRFRSHEVLIINGPATGPNAVRSPEIRNTAFSRNPGSGEDHYPVRFSNVFDQIFQLSSHLTKP